MYKKTILIFLIIISGMPVYAQLGSYAGSFARIGFGARGLSMGNALVSDIFGDVQGYYNPALACFQENGILNFGYTSMTMDRKLNFVGFAKKFKLPNQSNGGAGISLSWINSGVGNIDGRDNDTKQIGTFSTFENQFYLGTGFLIDENFALGVGFKMYYSKLFDEVKTSTVAFDLGAIYRAMPNLSIGFTVRDISAKYKWETSKVYGNQGTTTENKFPTIVSLGGSYLLPKKFGTASIGFDTYLNPTFETKDSTGTVTKSEKTKNYVLKAGVEINASEQLKFRAGIDRIDLKADDFWGNVKPGAGIGFYKSFSKKVTIGLDYSFQLEPYTHEPIHNIGIGFKFN